MTSMKYTGLFLFLFLPGIVLSQSSYLPLNPQYFQGIDRYEILNGYISSDFHSSVKPYTRKSVANFADSLLADSSFKKSKRDAFNLSFLRNDSWEWSETNTCDSKKPALKWLYRKQSDAYHVSTPDFDLHVNPVVYFQVGREFSNSTATTINTRGMEIRGMIDRKVSFYTFFTDNQALLPSYVMAFRTQRLVIPNEGFNKNFKTNGVDFLSARGAFNFNITKHIALQFGHDRNFIGNGYRSLVLSDFASPYTFLKLNTKVWKLNYMNLFTEMNAQYTIGDRLYPKKYMAFHHLSLNLLKNLNIGVFESIAFAGRGKDTTKHGQFDLTYLNPIIFYRSVEQQLGSSDNALLGMDIKWNFLKHFSLYGQLLLDEFVFREILAGDGWWANKQALQMGMKYINVAGIKNLDIQGEMNIVRPFTYAHKNGYTSYTHYNQPLAHPLGANFVEMIGIVRYQPINRLQLTAKAFMVKMGTDTGTVNNGGDIFKDYTQRNSQEYGYKLAGGVQGNLILVSFTASYMLRHNFFIEYSQTLRKYDSAIDAQDTNTTFAVLAIRWNIPQRLWEF